MIGRNYKITLKEYVDFYVTLHQHLMQLGECKYNDVNRKLVYEYYSSYNDAEMMARIVLEDRTLYFYSYYYGIDILRRLQRMLNKYYHEYSIEDVEYTDKEALEKFNYTDDWIRLGILKLDTLYMQYHSCIGGILWDYEKCRLEVFEQWVMQQNILNDESYNLFVGLLLEHPKDYYYASVYHKLIRTIPLTSYQIEDLQKMEKNDKWIRPNLLIRKILESTPSRNLLYNLLDYNDEEAMKIFVNKASNRDLLSEALNKNRINSNTLNNSIRVKLGLKKEYRNKEKKEPKKTPAKLHVMLANESSKAVIIKGGKTNCIILWDRKDNSFMIGDALTTIYERYCDISPDGKHMFYHATVRSEGFSAICKLPILRDMEVYLHNSIGYGGMFLDNQVFQTHGNQWRMHSEHTFIKSNYFIQNKAYIEGVGDSHEKVYITKLIRDGWEVIAIGKKDNIGHIEVVLHKSLAKYWKIEQTILYNRSVYRLLQDGTKNVLECEGWDWAEYNNGELIFTKNSSLYILKNIPHIDRAILVKDFTSIKPKYRQKHFTLRGSKNLQKGIFFNDNNALLEACRSDGIEDAQLYGLFEKLGVTFEEQYANFLKIIQNLKEKKQLSYWHLAEYGSFLFQNKKFTEALAIYIMSLNFFINDDSKASTYIYLSVLYSYANDEINSLKYERMANTHCDKNTSNYSYQFSKKYMHMEKYDKAYIYYLQSMKDDQKYNFDNDRYHKFVEFEKLCEILKKSLVDEYEILEKHYTHDTLIKQRLSFAYIKEGDTNNAFLIFEKTKKLYEYNSYKLEIYISEFAIELYNSKEYTLSLEIFMELLKIDNLSSWDEAKYFNYVGVIYDKKEEYINAKEYFKKAMETKEDEVLYVNNYKLMIEKTNQQL